MGVVEGDGGWAATDERERGLVKEKNRMPSCERNQVEYMENMQVHFTNCRMTSEDCEVE